ncbi:hypothetical protein EUGRSUZ_J01996 [Eucalyptus grandis]|uniref:Uncharacterized protein n=2 Tax=Eucalyptus grandis TaxID=71139 RepID=A0ACC3J863_EUCGR|nr:hypothetical protein EUGRSUZ_J01996 [Eucalyptus grandis]
MMRAAKLIIMHQHILNPLPTSSRSCSPNTAAHALETKGKLVCIALSRQRHHLLPNSIIVRDRCSKVHVMECSKDMHYFEENTNMYHSARKDLPTHKLMVATYPDEQREREREREQVDKQHPHPSPAHK